MVVLTADQVRAWDRFTIQHEPISSINLMERAAKCCTEWLCTNLPSSQSSYYIFCGKGNNGADGLAIARMLYEVDRQVDVFILEFGSSGTAEFQQNLQRLHPLPVGIHYIQTGSGFPIVPPGVIIIDALLGTGTTRPVEGEMRALIELINASPNPTISIDMPSGLFADQSTIPFSSVRAAFTLTFQCLKPAQLLAENAAAIGDLQVMDIGLLPRYLNQVQPEYELTGKTLSQSIIRPRNNFSHKGEFGHALLLAGSFGKMGAAVLAARACLRCGPGLLSCFVPEKGISIMQMAVPEAMVVRSTNSDHEKTNANDEHLGGDLPPLHQYQTIGCGPGIGTNPATVQLFKELIANFRKPMVLDADALNILSQNQDLFPSLPPFSILTPHPKEFERLAGKSANETERINKARELAKKHQLIFVLKGHHSLIAMPGGSAYFNMSGNASMAKGGSGDVLTGMLTGLLCRGYTPEQAALLGVHLHGLAGEFASADLGMESVLAGDISDHIAKAFIYLTS
ncbi:bifunctional ADP-dependent NAD(P)H-hydrate dehydratase/NAD(P)H-hydrate epimerase [Flavihumibacter solisilvae]|uniref:Bifunctional NAD(P)H-hydrate repair enzyme n=1 Tax=Flavihumibacter solisilvae TaxID=1349421 RepID=A0A0C1ITK5_9BACT|nr:bifunctional ADP-dependent NAD(P)H-hydrate dehydratase/NAD(P)H-hydrate epimerase [Flavihumibacter solisilvae]KIC93784.1 hypothetical protein OI18_15575 [Flavihumibacter solisilvae]